MIRPCVTLCPVCAQCVPRVCLQCAQSVLRVSWMKIYHLRPFLFIKDHLSSTQTILDLFWPSKTISARLGPYQISQTIQTKSGTISVHHVPPPPTIWDHLAKMILVNLELSATISAFLGLYHSNSDHLTPSPYLYQVINVRQSGKIFHLHLVKGYLLKAVRFNTVPSLASSGFMSIW